MTRQSNQNKRRFFQSLRVAVFAALYAGCSAWTGLQADDSQIYINQLPSAQDPNVLFTIDTSGSMDSIVPNGGQTRIEAVKDALTGLVNNTTGLKAGLQRFHYELGGPIVFPVIDLDSTPSYLNNTLSVSSIDRSSDDAEEIDSTVTLDSTALEMTQINVGGNATVFEATSSPASSTDDDEDGDSGAYGITSPDLDFGQTDSGIRFPNVIVPKNAVILHAEVVFEATGQASDDNTDVNIYGDDVDDSPTFVEGSGVDSVSSRFSNATDAGVTWSNLVDVSDGDKFTTPNIRSIVQEIVNRDGWSASNAMTILFQSEQGHHTPATFDDGSHAKPLLRIQYVTNGTALERQVDNSRRDAGEYSSGGIETRYNGFYVMRDETNFNVEFTKSGVIFRDIDIPDNAVVVWADIRFTAREQLNSDPADVDIFGMTDTTLNGFSNGNKLSDQTLTTAKSTWSASQVESDEQIFEPEEDDIVYTSNLASIVEEIRTTTSFESGDNMGFIFQDSDGSNPVNERHFCSYDGVRNVNGCPEDSSARPTLHLVYAFPTGGTPENQEVGLRFNDVTVPQGATIENAYLEFTVDAETNEAETLTIQIEDNTEPQTYSNDSGQKISDRTYGSSVTWTTDSWDTIGDTKQTPDISTLVSSVTNQTDWCGGGSLAFRITGTDARDIAQAFDKGESGAPRLRIKYNTDNLTAGEGCTTRQTSVSIEDENDDVEENYNGDMSFNSNDLDLYNYNLVGLRFQNVEVPAGAKILSTNLYLTGDDTDDGTNNITIKAEQHPNAPAFSNNDNNLSSRNFGSNSIVWTVTDDWVEDGIYSTQDDGVDLTPLIQDIIDGTVVDGTETWASGNALVFSLDSDAGYYSGDRQAEVCCGGDPSSRLEIFYEINLGDIANQGQITARSAMLSIIDELVASGFTPPVDALFEAGSYFESWPVHFGRTRGAGQSYESYGTTNDSDLDSDIAGATDSELLREGELSRLSHYATYEPQDAEIVRDGSCTELDPNNRDCRTERIANAETDVNYVSPFEGAEECEKGFLVLLSDGIANRNSSRDLIQSLTGRSSCPLRIPQIDGTTGDALLNGDGSFNTRSPSSDEECGLELAQYMYNKDYIDEANDETDVKNNVRTYTIGFDLDTQYSDSNRRAVEFLKALAFVGNGGDLDDPDGVDDVRYGDDFYTASNADELRSVFETIVNDIIKETTSFVAPGLSINAFNRLFNLDDIYFSLFQPESTVGWLGNLKKFKLCTNQSTCNFGETVDKNANPAVYDDETDLETFGTLKESAKGFWSEDDDGAPQIDEGGAGEKIPPYTERVVYVNTDDGAVEDNGSYVSTGSVADLGLRPHKIELSTDVGDAPASEDDFNDLKTALTVQHNNCSSESDIDARNSCLNDLIYWMTGKKFSGDLPRDGTDSDDDRWAFGDPMHSRPLVLTYGRDERDSNPDHDVPLSKIIVGTNDGGIRMINEGDGVEEWIFYPNSMLEMQSDLKKNSTGSHEYGVDDTPTARIKDTNDDAVIDPEDGDFVHIFFGLRRGGNDVFALNITPNDNGDGTSTIELDTGAPSGGRPDIDLSDGKTFKVSIGQKGKIEPEILWRIDGGPGGDPDFARLGYTWSTPRPARIQGNDGPRSVLIFGGGYDPSQDGVDDDGTSPDGGDNYNTRYHGDSMGNAIFIVDADTGDRLWWASSSPDGHSPAEDPDKLVESMNTSIVAPVTTLDTDSDGLTDRLYAVDLRGQVFRVDIQATPNPADGESEFSSSSVGVLARLGPPELEAGLDAGDPDRDIQPENINRRKFFYAPEVGRVTDTTIAGDAYDLIGLVSGNRTQPQGQTVQDRAYAIRDFMTENPDGGINDTNYPACNPEATSCTTGEPIIDDKLNPDGTVDVTGNLVNVTDKDSFIVRQKDDSGAVQISNADGESPSLDPGAPLDDLKRSQGWFFNLEGRNANDPSLTDLTGEKGFSGATVLDGKMFFTTFLPPLEGDADNLDVCAAPEVLGTSRFYAVDFFTGAPAFDRVQDGVYNKTERYTGLGTGPSADIIPAYLPGGVVLPAPTGAGALPQDPEVSELVRKSFWLEER